MSNTVEQFVITKNVDNTFIFTIKENGATTPMQIEVGDTFTFSLIKLEDEVAATITTSTIAPNGSLPLASGELKLTLSQTDVNNLVSDKAPKIDRYYNRPTYKLVIECNTSVNGDFVAKVPNVYVD